MIILVHNVCAVISSRKTSLRLTAGVGILFASNGAVFASLLPWYPTFIQRLGLTPAAFGLIVACFAVGALASSAIPAPLIRRFGPVPVALTGTVLVAVALALAPWAPAGLFLAAALFAIGFLDAIVDVAQNVAGIRVENAGGRPVLSSMHALWSLGGLAGGAAATAAASAGVLPHVHLVFAALGAIVLVTTGSLLLRDLPSEQTTQPAEQGSRRRRWRIVVVAALPLLVVSVTGTIVEDVANNWAALSAVEIARTSPEVAGIAFSVLIGSQCIGRFTGDPLIARIGRPAVARFGGAAIAVGAILVITSEGSLWRFLLGFALAGFGCATLVPSAFAAAATLPGVSEGAGVTLISWLMRAGFLFTSPAIGVIATATDLRVGLALLIPAGLAAMLLAGSLHPGPDASETRRA